MNKYHKINTIFKRNMKTKELIEGAWSDPVFEYLQYNNWHATEKIDGTNIRVMWNGENISFAGKTDNAEIPTFLLAKLHSMFDGKEELFREILGTSDNVCLYGEGYGNKIQKCGKQYISNDVDFIVFDVKIGNFWLERENILDIASHLGVKVVNYLGKFNLWQIMSIVRNGFYSSIQAQDNKSLLMAEGIVAYPECGLKTRNGERIITKIKHRDFFKGEN